MKNNRLNMLYRTLIKEHYKNPSNFRVVKNATGTFELLNPSCGDQVIVYYALENNRITDISFQGHGCAISVASASIMTELIQSKTVDEAKELITALYELVKDNDKIDTTPLKDAVYLQGVSKFPTRIRCATLSWHALEQGLNKNEPNMTDLEG